MVTRPRIVRLRCNFAWWHIWRSPKVDMCQNWKRKLNSATRDVISNTFTIIADISALSKQIFVKCVSIILVSLQIFVFRLEIWHMRPLIFTRHRNPQNFEAFWCVLSTPVQIGQLRPFRNGAVFQNVEINLVCADDWAIVSWNLVDIGPHFRNLSESLGPQNVRKRKIDGSEANSSEVAEDGAKVTVGGK